MQPRVPTLVAAIALAVAFPAAAEPQQCALSSEQPRGTASVTPQPSRTPGQAALMTPLAVTPPAASEIKNPLVPEEVVRASPALVRIQQAGARLYDLGFMHGLRTVFALQGDAFQVFYLAPDGGAAIRGLAQDGEGKNLTRAQLAGIPGALPTIRVTAVPPPAASALEAVEAAHYGTWGPDVAARVYVVIDPLHAVGALKPYVEAGKLQVAIVPVAILDHEDQGRSTPAAIDLLRSQPTELKNNWDAALCAMRDGADECANKGLIRRGITSPEAEAAQRLRDNQQLLARVGMRGTPTFVWAKRGGGEGRIDGTPTPAQLQELLISLRG
ncbi:MAG: hypothetical protein JOY71_02790 [Acetobacteraceae bacterium]|nr:hypothetical protein [Acetobacteraceae bacterium]